MQLHVVEQGDLIQVFTWLCTALVLCGFIGAFLFELVKGVLGMVQAEIRRSVWFHEHRARSFFRWGSDERIPHEIRQRMLAKSAKHAQRVSELRAQREAWVRHRAGREAGIALPGFLAFVGAAFCVIGAALALNLNYWRPFAGLTLAAVAMALLAFALDQLSRARGRE